MYSGMMTGITGGIGTGKSVVSRILRLNGYHVLDCDYEARVMMEQDEAIINALRYRWGDNILHITGLPDRAAIARIVFSSREELDWLNGIIHGRIRDLADECKREAMERNELRFVESAILYSSGLSLICDEVWRVEALEAVRIERVINRSGMTRSEVEERILAQANEKKSAEGSDIPVRVIMNDDNSSLLSQVLKLVKSSKQR